MSLEFKKIDCDGLIVTKEKNICPNVNVGIIISGDKKFMITIIYPDYEELLSLGVKFEKPEECCFIRCFTRLRITLIENDDEIKFLASDELTISLTDSKIVFQNKLIDFDQSKDPYEIFSKINARVVPLIGREIGDLKQIMDFILDLKTDMSIFP